MPTSMLRFFSLLLSLSACASLLPQAVSANSTSPSEDDQAGSQVDMVGVSPGSFHPQAKPTEPTPYSQVNSFTPTADIAQTEAADELPAVEPASQTPLIPTSDQEAPLPTTEASPPASLPIDDSSLLELEAPGTRPLTAEEGWAPDYLNPEPNPLLLPVYPEDVELIGTQPITLEQAIELAYRNNEDLQAALLELERSQAALREVEASLYPNVDLDAGLQLQEGGTGQLSSDEVNTVGSAGVSVTYNVFSSGRRESLIEAARQRVRLSELTVEQRQEQLRLNTVNEFYDLQATVEAIRINEAFLEEAERNLRDTRLREEVGVGTRFDVLRAEVQVANARQDLVQSLSDKRTAQRRLSARLNLPPSIDVSTPPVSVAPSWPLSLEESIVLAFQNRAELEQQLIQQEINTLQARAAIAELGPNVNVFANYDLQDNFSDGSAGRDTWQLGAQVTFDLYDGGAAAARARQEEISGEIAATDFASARNQVRLEVEEAFFDLQANLENINTATLAVEQAREALNLARLRFEAGVGTQLDVLSAQSELVQAEERKGRERGGEKRAVEALERAVSNLPDTISSSP